MQPLPIDPLLPEIVASLRGCPNLVLEAPPGAGKTTRVPKAMLDAGLAGRGEILVLQPRRLPARLAARRVAEEAGERLGETIGYQVRFEEVAGPKTRLRFITEGLLTRRLLGDPKLQGVGAVVLDEFHERHLQGDIGLALLRRLQRESRPDLKLVAMSATLEAGPVVEYLGGCPRLRSEGRRFEVAIEHLDQPDDRYLDKQVASAVRRLVSEGLDGDVLVFLPGAAEIRRAREALEPIAQSAELLVLPLHGDLPPAEQDRAVRPADRRKVILSTNVAETSVTIDGVVAVIDSGLARAAGHSPWSGLPTLKVAKVSRASATQRAGRAGRTRPGRCLRLYTKHDHDGRPDHEAPEVRRLDLCETLLDLSGMGVRDFDAFEWFEAPLPASLAAAQGLLRRLGAIGPEGLTEMGRKMLRFPVHPRQARLLVEAEARGVAEEGCLLAALIGERDIRSRAAAWGPGSAGVPPAGRPPRPTSYAQTATGPSDLLELLEVFQQAQRADFAPERLRSMGLEPGAASAVDRVRRSLARVARTGLPPKSPAKPEAHEAQLLISVLAGYPDRVARRRRSSKGPAPSSELLLAAGGTATLSESSVVREAELLVAVDVEERQGAGGSGAVVRLASEVQPEWLLDLFAESIRDATEAQWNAEAERVDVVSRLLYDKLVLEESRAERPDPALVAKALAEAALQKGPRAFAAPEEIDRFLVRTQFVAEHFPESGLKPLTEEDLRQELMNLCEGRRSFEELREASLVGALTARLGHEQARLLATMAPEKLTLPGGRQARIEYEAGKPPWFASRMQDFFGMASAPVLAGGRVSLVLHLLAPNQRAVQVTTDLAGFWSRHYPSVRKELSRRYPRHSWPEDPLSAKPPAPHARPRR